MFFTCLSIFFARIADVSLSTFRTLFMVKKNSILIPIIAFFEVLIWFYAAREALNTDIDSILIPIFYSLGYATGTYLGAILSKKLIHNYNNIEIITQKNNTKLINKLHEYNPSIISIKTNNQPQDLITITIKNNETNNIINIIKQIDKKASITIKDIKIV